MVGEWPNKKAPQEVRRIPRKQFDAVMGGAKAAMRELTEFAEQAKSRLREDRPIKQDDLLELLRKLVAAQKWIDAIQIQLRQIRRHRRYRMG